MTEQAGSLRPTPGRPPLCGVDALGDARQAIVVADDKSRVALAMATGRAVVSWPGGTQGGKHCDWSPLKGRNVVIWPDADKPGLKAGDEVAATVSRLGATVRVLDVMRDQPAAGWNAAAAVDDGWGKAELDMFMRETVQPWSPPEADAPNATAVCANDAPSPASPYDAVAAPAPLDEASLVEFKRSDEPARRVGQILGIERFDYELEAWLIDRQWAVKTNQLSGCLEVHRPSGVVPMNDERLAELRFAVTYASNGKEPAKEKIADAVALIGERRAYHPVLNYLDRIEWDGVPRLDEWLIDFLGAEDTLLNRAFGRKVLCAAVRRVRQPGCKFDSMLVLQGAQDLGKSSAIRALCDDPLWFTDQLEIGADPKLTIEKTAGSWIVEFPELDGMGRRDTNRVKSFITTTEDRARLAYARYAVTRPRQFVLFGTTNEERYLADTTGNRRFWIVKVGRVDPAGIAASRDQLWAEAAQAEPHERLWLDTDELKTAAAAITRDASDFGPWVEMLENAIPEGPLKIRAADVWKIVGLGNPDTINKLTKAHHDHLRRAMLGLQFEKKEGGIRDAAGRNHKAFVRGDLHDARWWSPGDPPPASGHW